MSCGESSVSIVRCHWSCFTMMTVLATMLCVNTVVKNIFEEFPDMEDSYEIRGDEWHRCRIREKRRRIPMDVVDKVAVTVVDHAANTFTSVCCARNVSCDLSLPWSTKHLVLRFVLPWFPYKVHSMLQLHSQDLLQWHVFTLRFFILMEVDNMLPKSILWTNEAHLTLGSMLNTQNCSICCSIPTHVERKTTIALHLRNGVMWIHKFLYYRSVRISLRRWHLETQYSDTSSNRLHHNRWLRLS